MSSTTASPRVRVLADLLPGARVRDAVLVTAGAVTLVAAGQIAIPLPFTPVPLSLATFAVILVGAGLGPLRGLISGGLYLALGLAGAPVFASHRSDWEFASFGYLIGYLLAIALVGWSANHHADHRFLSTFGLGVFGSIGIYACGVPWLMGFAHLDFVGALQLGVLPFLIGDVIKVAAVAALLPTTWNVVRRTNWTR
ncbi:MAG: BioY protein [Microbacteriaceae bacterium]|jgi:biotin transport system substrate-specific component|nr:BioY protein [Microbacteriaceae bacterium]